MHGLNMFAREHDEVVALAVTTILDDALGLCRARIRTHGVTLELAITTAAQVRGRSIELSQVVVNLLNNAFDAAHTSAEKWIRLSTRDLPDRVQIFVEDSGPGIPAERHDDVFRSFFTTKAAGAGTGLGLSISRRIVDAHGGSLTIDPHAPNTRFVIELPT
ncbi:MAG: ATP-binding protein [Proteobacteria bacterium]|nr:ATP-binding protein [Pseudomonadota bacterium]